MIVSVDGTLVADWSLNDAVDRITGRKAPRSNWKFADLMLKNFWSLMCQDKRIEIPSVKGFQILERDEDGKPTWDWPPRR